MTSEQGDGFWKTRQKDVWNNPHAYDGTEWGDAFKVIAPKKRKMSMWWVLVLIAVLCTIFAYLAHADPQNLVVGQHYQGNLFACKTESDGEVLLKLISSGDTKAAWDYLSADDNTCGTQASTFTPMKVIVSITSSAGVMWHLMQIQMPEGVAFLVTVASLDGGA
jgi:hypothetical protein